MQKIVYTIYYTSTLNFTILLDLITVTIIVMTAFSSFKLIIYYLPFFLVYLIK